MWSKLLWFMFVPSSWLLLLLPLLLFPTNMSDGPPCPPCIPVIPLSWDMMEFWSELN